MKRALILLAGVGVGLVWAEAGLADAVFTSDGSKFVGKIEQMAGGKLVLVSQIAGRLEIDASKIVAIDTDRPLMVEFSSGDRLVGTIEAVSELDESVMHTDLGDVAIAPGKITAMWAVGRESPEMVALRQEVEQAKEAMKPDWSATLEAGGNFTEGNTDTLEGRGRFDLRRRTEEDLLHFFLAAQYSEQNDERITNEYRGGILYEKSFNERWYWYTRVEMEFDEFENLDLRSTATAGAGYYWLKKPGHELKNRMGFGYRHESYDNDLTRDEAVIDLGLNYRVDIAPWLQFTHATNYNPDFEDFDNYRLDLDTALIVPLKSDILKLKLGVRNEYNSRPQGGLERLDNTYYANIVLELVK